MRKEWFVNWRMPVIRDDMLTRWSWLVKHRENLELGRFTDIGAFTYIQAEYGVIIGDYVEIGSHTSIYSKSTIDNKKGKVIIGKGAKIGSHSVIMPNVTIGENAVIGAFSFINKNIPANVTAYGIPCKIIKKKNKSWSSSDGLLY